MLTQRSELQSSAHCYHGAFPRQLAQLDTTACRRSSPRSQCRRRQRLLPGRLLVNERWTLQKETRVSHFTARTAKRSAAFNENLVSKIKM